MVIFFFFFLSWWTINFNQVSKLNQLQLSRTPGKCYSNVSFGTYYYYYIGFFTTVFHLKSLPIFEKCSNFWWPKKRWPQVWGLREGVSGGGLRDDSTAPRGQLNRSSSIWELEEELLERWHQMVTKWHQMVTKWHQMMTKWHQMVTNGDKMTSKMTSNGDKMTSRWHQMMTKWHQRWHHMISNDIKDDIKWQKQYELCWQ